MGHSLRMCTVYMEHAAQFVRSQYLNALLLLASLSKYTQTHFFLVFVFHGCEFLRPIWHNEEKVP